MQGWYADVREELLAEWKSSRAEEVAAWTAERELLQLQLQQSTAADTAAANKITKYELYLDRSASMPGGKCLLGWLMYVQLRHLH